MTKTSRVIKKVAIKGPIKAFKTNMSSFFIIALAVGQFRV
jgi:hypothetical protein